MSARPITIQGVRAKLKKAAAAEGLYVTLSHSLKGWRAGVHLDSGYPWEAERAGLDHWTADRFPGTLMDWVRRVLTADELTQVSVLVTVSNSEPMVDYFSEDQHRVLPDWDSYVQSGAISYRWANGLLGVEVNGWTYDRGTFWFTEQEISSLCPSDAHALGLALCAAKGRRDDHWTADTVRRLAALDDTGRSLFQAMRLDWAGTLDELVDTVEVLVPGEVPAPAPVEPAPVEVEPVRAAPDALVEYLGRLLHVPKKEYARAVWIAVRDGAPVPTHSADWAGDVVRKVRRYANA
jgi:hypothetical protein